MDVADRGGARAETTQAEPSLGFVITIDGPAGAGKSSVARALARRLGFQYLDTGAMYRAATLAALRAGKLDAPDDELADFVGTLRIELRDDRVLLNGEDVTDELRSRQLTRAVRRLANSTPVRKKLVALQRAAGYGTDLVAEGRDQGTVVFPDAAVKIFLTATPQVRARRRLRDLAALGERVSLDTVLKEIVARDRSDQQRSYGPLLPAPDAIIIDTSELTLEEVVDRIERIARQRLSERKYQHDA